jgi:hypothetical protein
MLLSQPAGGGRGNTKEITGILLPAFPHFLAVLIRLQPMFQLLGAALLLGGRARGGRKRRCLQEGEIMSITVSARPGESDAR